ARASCGSQSMFRGPRYAPGGSRIRSGRQTERTMPEETGEQFIYVRERRLPYETFDADNHLYETKDAFLQFLPKEYEGAVKYVEVSGRIKLALRDHISEYIPNPTFNKVAVPGSYGRDVSKGDGKPIAGAAVGVKPKVMPGIDAFFDPEPRLALMKDMGID